MLTEIITGNTGKANTYFYGNLRPLVLIASICVFLTMKGLCSIQKPNKIVRHVSSVSFGIYLIHPLFIRIIQNSGFYNVGNPWLSVPIYASIIFMISDLTATLLSKIKIMRRYIL